MIRETDADRRREAAVAEILARAWRCRMEPTARLSGYDFIATRPVAVVEIKCRFNRRPEDYGGVMFIDAHKRDVLLAAAADAGVQAAIIVWWFPGEVRWIDARKLAGRPVEDAPGRADRGAAEPCRVVRLNMAETSRLSVGEVLL